MPESEQQRAAASRTACTRVCAGPGARAAAVRLFAASLTTLLPAVLHAAPAGFEEIVVTATRQPQPALETGLSLSAIDADTLRLVGSTHHAESLNRVPGVMIQRGSGQESLTAIRSPVLTGAGACGAFLFLENGVPIRPVGFCNVNELFEVNTEQARAIEVLRGPGTALYGSNAMHGTVNVLQPAAAELPARAASVEAGPADYWRVEAAAAGGDEDAGYGVHGLYTDDGGWRDDAGYAEAKLNGTTSVRRDALAARFDLAATDLDQQTAGFIFGQGAYRSDELSEQNLNPEAYRDAHAVRLTGLVEPAFEAAAGRGVAVELRPYLRTSRMEFLQHFLVGKPLERNGQESLGLMSSAAWGANEDTQLVTGLDLELARSFLEQEQDGPATDGPPAANAIRPPGRHYDYEVQSWVTAAYVHAGHRYGERWRVTGGLRAEAVGYDYDNRMLSGNTDENGVPCGPAGCLYSRPADRTDAFLNVAPKLGVSYTLRPGLVTYGNAGLGFRPPEITELYRLQRAQAVADLDSEQLRSLELGLKASLGRVALDLAVFDMQKDEVILRESNGFNVSNGRTSHEGVEYDLRWRPLDDWQLTASGTYARHRYEFSRAVEGGESIVKGNDVDTAPRQLHRAAIGWNPGQRAQIEAEWLVVGEYYLDAANAHRYPGHGLLNVRGRWHAASGWWIGFRLTNALDRNYADRADFAFGDYRYFPGRGRATFAEVGWSRD